MLWSSGDWVDLAIRDVRLLPLLIGAEQRLAETNLAEAEQVLAGADDYSSPFLRIPF